MDRVAWQATVHGATRSQTWLSKGAHYTQGASQVVLVVRNLPDKAGDIRDVGQEDPLEEGMATHSSILAWRIPWTEEPGGQ